MRKLTKQQIIMIPVFITGLILLANGIVNFIIAVSTFFNTSYLSLNHNEFREASKTNSWMFGTGSCMIITGIMILAVVSFYLLVFSNVKTDHLKKLSITNKNANYSNIGVGKSMAYFWNGKEIQEFVLTPGFCDYCGIKLQLGAKSCPYCEKKKL